MNKYLLPIFIIAFPLNVFAQVESLYNEQRKKDSLEIEKIKKQIPFLNEQTQIDSLNGLSEKYSYIVEVGGFIHKADSMYAYAFVANQKATRINYKKGILFSLVNLARSEDWKHNDKKCAEYLHEAIQFEKENSGNIPSANTALGHAYSMLGDISFNIKDFTGVLQNFKIAIQYYQKDNYVSKEAELYLDLSTNYTDRGKYEEAFDFCQKGMKLVLSNANTRNDLFLIQPAFWNMALLYKNAGDYETSLSYLRQLQHYPISTGTMSITYIEMGVAFRFLGNLDSSIYYIEKSIPQSVMSKIELSYTYLLKKEYPTAMKLVTEAFDEARSSPEWQPPYFAMGKCYFETKKFKQALGYTKEAIRLAEKSNLRPAMMEGYELISGIYHELNDNKKAYFYHTLFSDLKDSILNRQFLLRLNNYKKTADDEKKEVAIELLNKDNKIKQQKLKQQVLVRNLLFGTLLIILLAAIFIIRTLSLKRKNEKLQREQLDQKLTVQQLESEKKQAQLQQQAAELEMQALRSQMNPHFIFNCLNSINRFIFKNENEAASKYLTRFSRLIRLVLIHSQKQVISLENEVEMLRLYLDMECLRFKDSFHYTLALPADGEMGMIYVPPLIFQPFCENAIWHGLLLKEGDSHLDISIFIEGEFLNCIIADNGVGRTKSAALKMQRGENNNSMGLKITRERLALFNDGKANEDFFEIDDLENDDETSAGTRVKIKIAYKNMPYSGSG